MALSNIFREPRREITETVIGLAIFAVFLFFDYHFALWVQRVSGGPERGIPLPLGLITGVAALVFSVILLGIIHLIGEGICDSLANRGVELRPKRRSRW